MGRRILLATAGIIAVMVALNTAFFGLMTRNHGDVLGRVFTNARLLAQIEALIDTVVIRADGERVVIDEARLAAEVSDRRLRAQVRSVIPFLRVDERGRVSIDRRSVEVRHRAEPRGGWRGPIWDRGGTLLAYTERDPKTQRTRRVYPLGAAAFHVVGASHPAFGERGIEAAYQDELGRGAGVTLTLSAGLQRAAAAALADRPGAVVVLAVPSGEVLALASAPSFDPNERRAEAWLAAERDSAAKPFLNRAVGSVYPPGSTFKVVDLAAWLDAPGHDPNLSLNCQGQHAGYRIRDAHIHGPVGLRSAFARSCNIYFAEVGVRLGPRLMRMAERLGFNAPLPLLPEGRAGLTAVRSRAFSWQDIEGEHAFQAADFRRNPKLVAQSAIGQNLVVATPLQMARVAAIIGADGRSVAPAVFRSVGHFPDVAERGGPGVGLVTPASELVVARMMEVVMTEGTGRGLPELYQTREGVVVGRPAAADGAPRVPLAGKTGTAEVATGPHAKRPHSWFIGFAPADRPEVAVAVLVEHGGAGAEVAGPIAVRLLGEALNVIHSSPLAHGTADAGAGAALAPE